MNLANLKTMQESREIKIADQGKVITVHYSDLEDFHSGDSWWGCTVGFRAMQMAAEALSQQSIWDRDNLYIVSAHPGPGVLDAIDFVTCCVTKKRFRLTPEVADAIGCSRDMKFEWWVSNGCSAVKINLRSGFVPNSFYELLDRLNTAKETPQDKEAFNAFKTELSTKLWLLSLQSAFSMMHLSKPLSLGELPNA